MEYRVIPDVLKLQTTPPEEECKLRVPYEWYSQPSLNEVIILAIIVAIRTLVGYSLSSERQICIIDKMINPVYAACIK
ncbi:MAG: DUF1622 domain-containing protein [Methanotrichaceae archaeon]|nr:DUF1622 domain-containing protein [Methanotrichaceae archaeon]